MSERIRRYLFDGDKKTAFNDIEYAALQNDGVVRSQIGSSKYERKVMTYRSPLSAWVSFLAVVVLAALVLILTFTDLNAAGPQ